ncbi:MAG: hypothetical protein MJ244_05490 [Clostridia bacterium]|nr:hypothetical protein [Clostridia bacterium]
MSEEKKTFELKDEELSKVSGGAKYVLSEVNVGDVFLLDKCGTFVVKSDVADDGSDPRIPVIEVSCSGGVWTKLKDNYLNFYDLNRCTYSLELTGTLNHLLK